MTERSRLRIRMVTRPWQVIGFALLMGEPVRDTWRRLWRGEG